MTLVKYERDGVTNIMIILKNWEINAKEKIALAAAPVLANVDDIPWNITFVHAGLLI